MVTFQLIFLLTVLGTNCLASNKGEHASPMLCANINAPNYYCAFRFSLLLTRNLILLFHLVESYFRNLSLCVITDKNVSFIGVRNSFKIMQNSCYYINEK